MCRTRDGAVPWATAWITARATQWLRFAITLGRIADRKWGRRRGGNPHRHGRCAQLGYLAGLPLWCRPQRGRPVCAIELRNRHEDGFLADADAGGFLVWYRHRAASPGSGRTGV